MYDIKAEYKALASSDSICWQQLQNASVLVTGATGLIGSCCIRALLERNRCSKDSNITVYALVRSVEKAEVFFSGYSEEDGLHYLVQDVCDSIPLESVDYLIHAACPTASNFFTSHPVETADAIVLGTRNMLRYALENKVSSMVYVSSMEVYGDGNSEAGLEHLLDESHVGSSDVTEVRSCYPEGKRMAENYCADFAAEYGVNVKIARLAQTFGPGIPKSDTRLFAQVARAALNDQDVVLKTTGESTRMYSYIVDAVAAILTILLKGKAGKAYNVANPDTYSSVRGMAEQVLEQFGGGNGHVIIDVDPHASYPPEHHLPLDISSLRELGWEPRVSMEEMYRRLIAYLAN